MSNNGNNWANRGKAALATVSAVPEGMTRISGGAGEEIVAFYRFTEPSQPVPKAAVLAKGQSIEGTYQGFYVNKKFGNNVHKVKTAAGLVALPNATQLNNALKGVTEGTKLVIIYNGKNAIKTGQFAGKQSHSFDVYAA